MRTRAAVRPTLGVGIAAFALLLAGCSTNQVNEPGLDGPSTFGLALRMTATPDIVLADGFSSSVVQATLYDQNGRAVQGRQIVFTVTDSAGISADIGELHSRSGQTLGTSVTETTDSVGLAQVVYYPPARTDATANQSIVIKARPIGNDAAAALYQTVRIELRSAEPKLFPQGPSTNTAPKCNFLVQGVNSTAPGGVGGGTFRAGQTILFQDTSTDTDGTIIRYEWWFGDGVYSDHPDNAHIYRTPGTYKVDHVVTDNYGAPSACTTNLIVQ